MKLISVFHTSEAADDLRQRMERSGIVVIVQSPVSVRPGVPTRHLVFAAVERQYEDAIRLLNNPEHKVVHRLNPADFAALSSDPSVQKAVHQTINRTLFWVVSALLFGVVLVAMLVTR